MVNLPSKEVAVIRQALMWRAMQLKTAVNNVDKWSLINKYGGCGFVDVVEIEEEIGNLNFMYHRILSCKEVMLTEC